MSANSNPPKLAYSIAEACAATSLSRATIYNRIRDGSITARRVCGRTLIPTESLEALLRGEAA